MAIVTYKRRGFVLGTYTNPMKLGILCALDIKLRFEVYVSVLSVRPTNFLTKLLGTGSATFNSHIQQFLKIDTLFLESRRADST
jgi:hypothetical protein